MILNMNIEFVIVLEIRYVCFDFIWKVMHSMVIVYAKELYRNGGLSILCYVPHEICWGILRIERSLRIASVRQAWPIRPKFGLDTETKSSPPFLYSSLVSIFFRICSLITSLLISLNLRSV